MANNKFIWDEGDIKVTTEENFKKSAKVLYEIDKPYETCCSNPTCSACDEQDKVLAEKLAKKIFESYFAGGLGDLELMKSVLANFVALCKKLLPSENALSKQLYNCAVSQFLRFVKTNTKITIDDKLLETVFANKQLDKE